MKGLGYAGGMVSRWGILVIVVLAGRLALTGCTVQQGEQSTGSGTNPPAAPTGSAGSSLVLAGGVSDVCADGGAARAFTFGIPVTNRSDEAVHLVSAEFEYIAGVELIGTWLVGPEVADDDPDASTSWTADYPPETPDEPGWPDRTAIGDSTISAHSSTWVGFAIQLSDGATAGNVAQLTLDYEDAAGSGTLTDQSSYGIGRNDNGTISCAL
jgi:hypothetical protein